jgi:hypothetical protein
LLRYTKTAYRIFVWNPSVNPSPGRTRKEQDNKSKVYLRDMVQGVMDLASNHGLTVRSVKFVDATAKHLVIYMYRYLPRNIKNRRFVKDNYNLCILFMYMLDYKETKHITSKRPRYPLSGRRASSFSNVQTDPGVPVTTAWRVLRLRTEERPPIWKAAVNKLNKQPRTAD